MAYYCTASDMLRYFGAEEMAQRAVNEAQPIVTGALFQATVYASDRSSWTAPERDNADDGLTRLNQILVDAGDFVNSYLRSGYDVAALALTPPETLRRATADLARYMIYDDGHPPDIKARRDEWLLWLQKVSIGEIQITTEASTANAMTIWSLERS